MKTMNAAVYAKWLDKFGWRKMPWGSRKLSSRNAAMDLLIALGHGPRFNPNYERDEQEVAAALEAFADNTIMGLESNDRRLSFKAPAKPVGAGLRPRGLSG